MSKSKFSTHLCIFFRIHPSLFFGLCMLLGSAIATTHALIFFIPLTILLSLRFSLPGIALFVTCLLFTPQDSLIEGYKENVCFEIDSLSETQNHFSKGLLYKGILTENEQRIPCSIFVKNEQARPDGNTVYKLSGTLHKNFFKPDSPWIAIEKKPSLAETRFKLKTKLRAHIQEKIKSKPAALFLGGIFTGDLNDQFLRFSLGKLGLQHILAISGFHFAILAFLLLLPLKALLPPKYATLLLIVLLTLYFLFIGPTPSVMRAWISSTLFLFSKIIERESFALNRLGAALIIILLFNPLSLISLSFILSFGATLGILLFYEPCCQLLQKIWIKRTLAECLTMRKIDQIGYILLSFLRSSLALTMSVNLIVLPLVLFNFQNIPLLSFLYNLFIPLLTIPSMGFLLFALFFDLALPPLGSLLHFINSHYTEFVLRLITHVPPRFQVTLYIQPFSLDSLLIILSFFLFIGIFLHEEKSKSSQLFNWI